MNISPEVWDTAKLCFGLYGAFLLNRSDRNQRELFRRIRNVELACAANHGHVPKGGNDEDP